ncbi:MAG: NAD(P)H-dependent glycerol-3-phosphate dehydrogenase [Tetrasphaera sp.]|nr:NAD(P)H-dependent glycerol-3-phosphate dehydrogenase [Tetrasphaera sp.]
MKVTILGGGNWGTTVASLVARKHDTLLWARNETVVEEVNQRHTNSTYLPGFTLAKKLKATSDFEQAIRHAELLIVGVPTGAVRSTTAQARPYVRPWIPIVSLAKGFEQGSLLRMTQVIQEELPNHPVAALTGPNIAREIMAGQAAASVVATPDLAVARALQQVLSSGSFRVYTNHDVIGCELGGALKNVVALACGMAEGLGVGDNTRAMVMTRGLAELIRLGVAMGGEATTFAGLAGMGDLIATCLSPASRNRTVGEKLGRGMTLEEITGGMTMVAEGLKTAVTTHELAERYDQMLPIHETMYGVVTGSVDPREAYRGLGPTPGHEDEPG